MILRTGRCENTIFKLYGMLSWVAG